MVAASRGTVYLMISQAAFVFFGFLLNAYLARALSISDFGIVGLALTLSLVITTLLASGFSGASAKFVAESPSKAASIHAYCEQWLLRLSIASFCAVAFFGFLFASGVNSVFWAFVAGGAIVFTQAFYNQRLSLRSAFKDFEKVSIGIASLGVAKLLIAFALVSNGLGAIGALVSHAVSPIISFFLIGKRNLLNKGKFEEKKIWNYAWPYAFSSGVVLLLQNLDIFAVEAIIRNSVTTGFYVASTTLSRAVIVLLGSVAVGIFPSISILTSQKSTKTYSYLRGVFLYVFTLLVPIALFMSAGAYNVLSLFFSEKYVAAVPFLQILSISAALTTIIFISFGVLNAAGETKKTLRLALAFLFTELVVVYIATINYGAIGLAWGVLISTAIALGVTFTALRAKFGNVFPFTAALKLALIGIISVVPFAFIQFLIAGKWAVIPAVVIGLVFYFLMVALFKVYSNEDVKTVNSLVPKVFQPALLQVEHVFGYKVK